jgi:hypothetical protein
MDTKFPISTGDSIAWKKGVGVRGDDTLRSTSPRPALIIGKMATLSLILWPRKGPTGLSS